MTSSRQSQYVLSRRKLSLSEQTETSINQTINTLKFNNRSLLVKSLSSKPLIEAIRKIPKVIIIGVKKCGTRALLEYLKLHPLIKAPGPEPHFFDRNYHHQ
ncbi:HS3SA-like protein [Mya arenaria]|uniref:HS3SA-like protein n=1 Tax=Mya arenaria TaxID=6604 RepID=A0ABY7DJJ0_MYAAR|nr:HS3SA-like protein [Mya arenaria]